MLIRFIVRISAVFLFINNLAWGADYDREQRWLEEVEPGIMVGDAVFLTAKDHRFLAIYTPAEKSKKAVIVIHGKGVHPDWGLINVIRSALPEHGYSTLSVQMPVLAANMRGDDYTSTFPEAAARITAASEFLKRKGYHKIVVASHSMGSRMTNYYLSHHATPEISAWAAVGMPAVFNEKIKIPILDLYGEFDFKRIKQGASRRLAALKGNKKSKQTMAAGADHFFDRKDKELVKYIVDFYDRVL